MNALTKLELTLVAGPGRGMTAPSLVPQELTVDIVDGTPGAALEAALAARWPGAAVTAPDFTAAAFTAAGRPLSALVAGVPPLVDGAVIVAGGTVAGGTVAGGAPTGADDAGRPTGPIPSAPASPALALAVLSGPDAGAVFALRRGTFRLGRGPVELQIQDAGISRHHATVEVGTTAVTLDTVNGCTPCLVDGSPVGRQSVAVGQVLGFGSTTAVLTFLPVVPVSGSSPVQPALPVRHHVRRAGGRWAAAAVIPLLAGTAVAVGTGQWLFLVFAGTSAVAAVVPVLGGRKRRRAYRAALDAAAAADARRRLAAAPSLADIVLAALPAPPPGRLPASNAASADDGGVWLRLGTAAQPANVVPEPVIDGFRPPLLPCMPVVAELRSGLTLRVTGPRGQVDGLVRALLIQLNELGCRTILTGDPARLPLSARFLPHVAATANPAALRFQLGRHPSAVVIEVGGNNRVREVLGTAAGTGRIRLISCHEESPEGTAAPDFGTEGRPRGRPVPNPTGLLPAAAGESCPRAAHGSATTLRVRLAAQGPLGVHDQGAFSPDLASPQTLDRYARRRAAATRGQPQGQTPGSGTVPDSCTVAELSGLTASAVHAAWDRNGSAVLAPVPLGRAAAGVVMLDLERDGPHLLVAGTTGAGKSELLRTLVAGLALNHPPSTVTFLFIDFKGGSGLGSLAALPHCDALVTDINGSAMDRVLTSLQAEVRRREELFSRAGVPDLRHYSAAESAGLPVVPHLVVVIDEFRILVDNVPQALADLMRIAAVGRSLGIHLVMATQRPQGAISADIRANITTRICLRVQSAVEAQDVIGAPGAAAIPVTRPGRAYLRRGDEQPVEFQAAAPRLADAAAGITVRIRSARAAFSEPPPARAEGPGEDTFGRGLAELLQVCHSATGRPVPRAALAPGLPALIGAAEWAAAAGRCPADSRPAAAGEAVVGLGLIDVPERQSVLPLWWRPRTHSHLALIGPPGSGAASAALLAATCLIQCPGRPTGLYCLDGDGSLAGLAAAPGVGSFLVPGDLRAAVRLLQRLARDTGMHRTAPPLIALLVTACGTWLSALRSSPWPWAEDLLADIIRAGPRTGVVLVVTGERELLASRFISGVPNRLYFPKGASPESTTAWPRLPTMDAVPGRAAVLGPMVEEAAGDAAGCAHVVQLLHLTAAVRPDGPATTGGAVAQSGTEPAPWVSRRAGEAEVPFRILPLPSRIGTETLLSTGLRRGPGRLLLGVGGDGMDPISVRLDAGAVLLALGPPGSGKTSLLDALPVLNPAVIAWRRPAPGQSADDFWPALAAGLPASPQPKHASAARLGALVDDLHQLSADSQAALERLRNAGAFIVATAPLNPALLARLPLAGFARNAGAGLVLAPTRAHDGEFFGCRLDPHGQAPPGRAVLLVNGGCEWLQLASTQGS